MVEHLNQCLNFMHQTFKQSANPLEDTFSNCITGALRLILFFALDRDTFTVAEGIPLVLLLSQS